MWRKVLDIAEHLVGATITFGIAWFSIQYGPDLLNRLKVGPEYLTEMKALLIIVAVILLAVVISFSHNLLRWIKFRVLGEGKVCGLYVEAYFAHDEDGDRVPVVALLIVHFDLHAWQYHICGHAFAREKTTGRLVHNAHWKTLASHHNRTQNDCGIFYVHEGSLTRESTKLLRGTTFCDLPFSARSYRGGSFCDLEVPTAGPGGTAAFPATRFEVVRALDRDIKEFRNRMSRRTRWKCYLNLGAPPEDDFDSLVQSRRHLLIEHPEQNGVPRDGAIMREVWQALGP